MDVLGRFLAEQCVKLDDAVSASGTLYKAYVNWCEENGEAAATQTAFGLRLAERGFKKKKVHGVIHWLGLGLKLDERDKSGEGWG
jgi:putative DNA primase/helicase